MKLTQKNFDILNRLMNDLFNICKKIETNPQDMDDYSFYSYIGETIFDIGAEVDFMDVNGLINAHVSLNKLQYLMCFEDIFFSLNKTFKPILDNSEISKITYYKDPIIADHFNSDTKGYSHYEKIAKWIGKLVIVDDTYNSNDISNYITTSTTLLYDHSYKFSTRSRPRDIMNKSHPNMEYQDISNQLVFIDNKYNDYFEKSYTVGSNRYFNRDGHDNIYLDTDKIEKFVIMKGEYL